MNRTANALLRRNRAAARVRKLEDQLYAARQTLDTANRAVFAAQRDERTTVSFGGDEWTLVTS